MEKRLHGQIRTHDRKDGLTTYSLRVRAYGRREIVTLGTDADGWTMRKAERMLEQVLAQIQVGVWRPPSMSAGGEDPTFHEFAPRWCSHASRSCGRRCRRTTSGGLESICCRSSTHSTSPQSRSRSSTSTGARR